jgi:hypothetical protein
LGRSFVREDAAKLDIDVTVWHHYALLWRSDGVRFFLDGETDVVPSPGLGLVLWIDNQYAAFRPGDRLRFGSLPATQPASLTVADVTVEAL